MLVPAQVGGGDAGAARGRATPHVASQSDEGTPEQDVAQGGGSLLVDGENHLGGDSAGLLVDDVEEGGILLGEGETAPGPHAVDVEQPAALRGGERRAVHELLAERRVVGGVGAGQRAGAGGAAARRAAEGLQSGIGDILGKCPGVVSFPPMMESRPGWAGPWSRTVWPRLILALSVTSAA
ncbi:hypothetical protein SHIRM173S_00826 [Streptomyces hirsutus]